MSGSGPAQLRLGSMPQLSRSLRRDLDRSVRVARADGRLVTDRDAAGVGLARDLVDRMGRADSGYEYANLARQLVDVYARLGLWPTADVDTLATGRPGEFTGATVEGDPYDGLAEPGP